MFVQRFGAELRGFENRCAHRSFPLRTAEKGSGPIVCGFHHWHYDQEGRARGIPQCREQFGVTPGELGAKLTPIEIATCGAFVFGRFPTAFASENLEEFLGDGATLLRAMSPSWSRRRPQCETVPIKANWRLCYHITLDDYHSVAIHPTTFGRNGYLQRDSLGYFRFGAHSAFLNTPEPDAMTKLVSNCHDGTVRSKYYFIAQIFPNLLVAHVRSHVQFWHVAIQQYVPVAHDRSILRTWLYPSSFAADHAWHVRWTRRFSDPWRALAVRYFANRIRKEDNTVCEGIQSIAHQIESSPILGRLEERIAWFEEAYRSALTDVSDDSG